MITEKEKQVKIRNFDKYRLKGIVANLKQMQSSSLSKKESSQTTKAIKNIENIIDNWEK